MNPNRNVEIVGRRLELTESIRGKVSEMVGKLCEHDSDISRIRVELELERHSKTHQGEFIAKGHLDDHRNHFDVSARGNDLYKAISELGDKLDRLIRNKSRRRVTQRRNPSPIEFDVELPKTGTDGI
ncbi:ribosome-associated translation inhibitor RaiA [Pelagicoccus sp. NFK12]|uniref:Ribosome-associated translation inhibitor RaiA n=1 Tax=Pelagicoccus enzymogenes TaxID=2773457 RepID=A0A927IFL0_9BACT|nr:ribosome-associated translation inhibitor RaiA [Pelagicoccus enzymogenes]MBD5778216.1 ribosome-associated translation inhibitor RaiA [Pelagicoccus enzymogenes]